MSSCVSGDALAAYVGTGWGLGFFLGAFAAIMGMLAGRRW